MAETYKAKVFRCDECHGVKVIGVDFFNAKGGFVCRRNLNAGPTRQVISCLGKMLPVADDLQEPALAAFRLGGLEAVRVLVEAQGASDGHPEADH